MWNYNLRTSMATPRRVVGPPPEDPGRNTDGHR